MAIAMQAPAPEPPLAPPVSSPDPPSPLKTSSAEGFKCWTPRIPQPPSSRPCSKGPRHRQHQRLRHHSEAPPREGDDVKPVHPIWVGRSTREEFVPVRNIKDIVPSDMHEHEMVVSIEQLEDDFTFLSGQSRFIDAVQSLEQAISIRRAFFGDHHSDFLSALERYVVLCNFWGVQSLNSGKHTVALELFKKAEAMTEAENVPNFKRRVTLRASTFNNLCCYFRNRGKLNASVQFVEKALKLEQRYKEAESPATTHLNYSVLLSTMGRHEQALEHLETAIAVLHDQDREIEYELGEAQDHGDESGIVKRREQLRQETCSMLVIAHYNMWVEHVRLNRKSTGISFLSRAANIAKHKLGESSPLADKMEQACVAAKEQMALKANREAAGHSSRKAATGGFQGWARDLSPEVHCNAAYAIEASWPDPSKVDNYSAQDILSDTRQITLRGGRRSPRPPSYEKQPRRKSKLYKLQEQLYGHAPKMGCSVSGSFWNSHPKLQESKDPGTCKAGFVGSPILSQQAHGVQPMVSVRTPRATSAHKRVGSADTAGTTTATSVTQWPASQPLGSTGRSIVGAGSTGSSWRGGKPPSSPRHPVPQAPLLVGSGYLSPLPPGGPPESPQLTAAYEYHRRQIQMREVGGTDAEELEMMEPERLHAINILKERLDKRREKGLPLPTDCNRNRAATKIQALVRGHQLRRWSLEEIAREARRKRNASATGEAPSETSNANAALRVTDAKQRVAFRVIYAARRAFVEYNAAVKIQKTLRGCVLRTKMRDQVAMVVTGAASKVQAAYRSKVERKKLGTSAAAATSIQAAARRYLARRKVARIKHLARLVNKVSKGFLTRRVLKRRHQAAQCLQSWVRGISERHRHKRRQDAAVEIQRIFQGSQSRRLKHSQQRAACRIEALWRGHRARKRASRELAAAICIQRFARGLINRMWYRKFTKGMKRIQALRRGSTVRQNAFAAVGFSIRLQWKVRVWLKRRRDAKKEKAALILQRNMRTKLCRLKLQRQLVAAARIQARWKGCQYRRLLAERHVAVRTIQALVRGRQARQKWYRKQAGATRIQALARGVAARAKHRRLEAKVLQLSSFWRGRRTRLQLKAEDKLPAVSVVKTEPKPPEVKQQRNSDASAAQKRTSLIADLTGSKQIREVSDDYLKMCSRGAAGIVWKATNVAIEAVIAKKFGKKPNVPERLEKPERLETSEDLQLVLASMGLATSSTPTAAAAAAVAAPAAELALAPQVPLKSSPAKATVSAPATSNETAIPAAATATEPPPASSDELAGGNSQDIQEIESQSGTAVGIDGLPEMVSQFSIQSAVSQDIQHVETDGESVASEVFAHVTGLGKPPLSPSVASEVSHGDCLSPSFVRRIDYAPTDISMSSIGRDIAMISVQEALEASQSAEKDDGNGSLAAGPSVDQDSPQACAAFEEAAALSGAFQAIQAAVGIAPQDVSKDQSGSRPNTRGSPYAPTPSDCLPVSEAGTASQVLEEEHRAMLGSISKVIEQHEESEVAAKRARPSSSRTYASELIDDDGSASQDLDREITEALCRMGKVFDVTTMSLATESEAAETIVTIDNTDASSARSPSRTSK
eukprot:TRINITY_DN10881_c0_g1_i2.p1 TRINITY_DN10881_c0_g1~~TRINITY_DN10881_c0_g1_i2.p1  ORF type:complete len:1584 (+),score=332.04 TRINITY_DN10881_c0_g1_i2:188-4939(+)